MGDVVLIGPDRRKPYRVAARGAGLTMLAVAVVSAAGADDIPAWLSAVSAERSFYPVAAQIIPVFLLTLAVERSFFGNSKELPGAYRFSDVTLGFCLVVAGSGVAEFLCLWVSAFAPGVVAAASATLLTSGTAVGALLLIVGVAWQGLSPPRFARRLRRLTRTDAS
jgi:hypothetical protein